MPDTPSSPEQRTIAQRARSRLSQQAARRLPITGPVGWMGALPRDRFLDVAYRAILGRPADPGGVAHFGDVLDGGADRSEVLAQLRDSAEAQQLPAGSELAALHRSRQQFVRSLPKASRILDLGGTDLSDPVGAFVSLGYPYEFDELVIIDLPPDDRHETYSSEAITETIDSRLGPVNYRYHSMADLSGIADDSFDLVYSGQTFEHVTETDGHRVLAETRRVLRPGGVLCLDTPNRLVTRLQLAGTGQEFIDPDHEVEYTDAQMRALFDEHGFLVERAHGLGLMTQSVANGSFDTDELRRSAGMFDDIDSSYLLAYVCRVG